MSLVVFFCLFVFMIVVHHAVVIIQSFTFEFRMKFQNKMKEQTFGQQDVSVSVIFW